MVYKVCEFKGTPRIKISEEPGKSTIAGAKCVIRAIDNDNRPMYDIMCLRTECDEIMANPTSVNAVYDRVTKQAAITDPFAQGGRHKIGMDHSFILYKQYLYLGSYGQ